METHLQPDKATYEKVLGRILPDGFDIDEHFTPSVALIVESWFANLVGLATVERIYALKLIDVPDPVDAVIIKTGKQFLAAAVLSKYFRFGNINLTRSGAVYAASQSEVISDDLRAEIMRSLDATARGFAVQLRAITAALTPNLTCGPGPSIGNGKPTVTIIKSKNRSEFDREL